MDELTSKSTTIETSPDQANPISGEDMLGKRYYWVSLIVIVLLGFGIRAWQLEASSFDYDETYEILYAESDLEILVHRKDGFPPLYRYLTGNLFELTGNDQIFRWFSAFAGAATILIVGILGRDLVGPKVGLFCAFLLSTSAFHIQVSQLGRAYALYVFLAACYLFFAFQLRRDSSWLNWTGLIVTAWLSVATHYYAGLLLVLGGAMLLLELRGIALRRAFISAVVLTILSIPLLFCLKADMAHTDEFFHKVGFDVEAYAFTYLEQITGKTLGPSMTELRELGGAAGMKAMLPWALLGFVPVVILSISAWKQLQIGDRAWLLVLMLLPPPLVVLAAQVSPTGYSYRYMAWMIIPLMLVLGCGAAFNRKQPIATVASIMLVGLGIMSTWNRHYDERYAEQDFHMVVGRIQEASAGDATVPAVVAAPHYFGAAAIYALPEEWIGVTLSANPNLDEQDWDVALPDFFGNLGERKEYWLVAPWYPEDHQRLAVREELVEKLGAELVDRVTPTLMLYRVEVPTRL